MGVPTSTLSPPFLYTSTMRVLIGELMISSKAGTTLPEALTLTSIVPLSTVDNTRSFFCTPVRNNEISKLMPTIPIIPIAEKRIIFLLRSLLRTSFGISLSIYSQL